MNNKSTSVKNNVNQIATDYNQIRISKRILTLTVLSKVTFCAAMAG